MTRRIDCDTCRATGVVECRYCDGEGTNKQGNTCNRCGGSGLDGCPNCDGRGSVEVEVDDEYASMGW